IGDVHLGTSCSGVPDVVSSMGIDAAELTPASALSLSVDLAIKEQVSAVVFAGDVVENTNARFEALPPPERCLGRLLDASIEVIAVAGNHDVEALPRPASMLEGNVLLGAGGKWESRTIEKDGRPVAEGVGWSFGERHVRQSPVASLLAEPPAPTAATIPRIGLLRADLDPAGGTYAPVRQAELDNCGFDAWLLGHIHKPSIHDLAARAAAGPSGYLGSLVGLDRSETGPHGPWILRVGDGGQLDLEHVPLAPLRWEHVSISVEGLEDAEDVEDRLISEATSHVDRIQREGPVPRAVGLIARLTGGSPCHEEVRKRISAGQWNELGRMVNGTVAFFGKITAEMRPRIDLEEIAKGDDPAVLIAQRLISLEHDDKRSKGLLEQAREALAGTARDDRWSPVNEHRNATDRLSDQALRDVLRRSGMTALSKMLSHDESSGAPS
ncbi:MAG: metallophosphoesterase, partial [Rhodobacteraceae bacterium]|nr:metallophosphoesterase [Paracoccaceae bacterium]